MKLHQTEYHLKMIVKMDSKQIDAKNREDFHRLLHDLALALLRNQKEKVCQLS